MTEEVDMTNASAMGSAARERCCQHAVATGPCVADSTNHTTPALGRVTSPSPRAVCLPEVVGAARAQSCLICRQAHLACRALGEAHPRTHTATHPHCRLACADPARGGHAAAAAVRRRVCVARVG